MNEVSKLSTFLIQASIGLIVCILLAFCTIDLESAASDPTGYPVFTIIFDRWGPKIGVAFFLLCFLNTAVVSGAALVMLSCQVTAFARDGGHIYNDKLSYVSPRSKLPPYTNVFLSVGGILIMCLAFSPIASQIIYSLVVIATMIMYGLPMVFRILHSCRWVPGPFNYGVFGMPIHIWGLISVVYMAIMECFPPTRNWTWATLNWSWPVLLGVILILTVLWFAHGSRTYKSVDQELLAVYRERLLQSREGATETNVPSSSYIIGVKLSAQ
ncbi:hypothetical protein LZ30DRAFT_588073 [Colletotrichum cereale]|nr:hypothetical protein LZ30DRAFT_588073 [Colletotrichum cereale]